MKLHEYEPFGPARGARAIHLAGTVVLACEACGCRLTARESLNAGASIGPDAAWRHYPGLNEDSDARGCRVSCADRPHRIVPQPLPA